MLNAELLNWLESLMVRRLIMLLVVVVVVYFAIALIKRGINRAIKSTDNKYRARKATNFIGYLVVLISVIFIFNDKLGNLGVALGVTGAGIAFALQEVILSVAGWLTIVFSGKVTVGERVKIGDLKGDIIDIGILSTTFMEMGDWVQGDQYNGRIVTYTNSYVFREKIQSYSSEYPFLWDEIEVPIRFESDHQVARQKFTEIAEAVCGDYTRLSENKWKSLTNKFNVEKANVNPVVSLKFDQNWVTFTIRYIVDYKKRRSTKDSIFTMILDASAESKGKIQIATSTIEVSNVRKSG